MRIEGQFSFDSISPDTVWNFLTDPNRISECLPGCERLVKTGDDTYEMQMKVGIGVISGTFNGGIQLREMQPITAYQMIVNGSGAAGFVKGEGKVLLNPDEGGTRVQYTGNVIAGGPIASLGQRMIPGAARMIIEQFFRRAAGKLQNA